MKFYNLYLIPLLFLLVLTLSACGKKSDSQIKEGKEGQEVKEELLSTSIKDLLDREESLYCQAEKIFEEGLISSVYYFDNENERAKIESKITNEAEGITYNASFIIKDDWSYFWDDLVNIDGFKIKNEEQGDTEQEEIDMEEELEFKCRVWKVDESVFVLPPGKGFFDISEMLKSLEGMAIPENFDSQEWSTPPMEDFSQEFIDPCSFCNMIPAGPARDECLSSC